MCHPATFSNSFVPATDIAYPDPITGHFFGIDVPSTVPFYDVRISDNFRQPKALYGETLYSAERISYKLGLRTGWYPQKCDTPIISVQFSFDARSQLFVENIAGRINWVIDEFQKREKVYTLAGKYHGRRESVRRAVPERAFGFRCQECPCGLGAAAMQAGGGNH